MKTRLHVHTPNEAGTWLHNIVFCITFRQRRHLGLVTSTKIWPLTDSDKFCSPLKLFRISLLIDILYCSFLSALPWSLRRTRISVVAEENRSTHKDLNLTDESSDNEIEGL